MPRSYRTREWFSLGALAAGIVLLGWVYSPDRMILFPSRDPEGSVGAVRRTIPLPAGELEMWTAKSRGVPAGGTPDLYLLRFYGNSDRAERNVGLEAAEWSARPTVEIWGVNYPGYGGSTGPATLRAIAPASLAAYDALKYQADSRPIIVFGTSLGTTAALYLGSTRPVAGLILQNPPALRQIVLGDYGWWNLWLLAGPVALRIPATLDSVANARRARVPAVFLMAGADEIVPPKYQRLVLEAYAGRKRVIPLARAHHNDPLSNEAMRQLNADILWMLSPTIPLLGDRPGCHRQRRASATGPVALQPEGHFYSTGGTSAAVVKCLYTATAP
jgi:pimeloyl-ACP methyl ester carboxylesterase